VLAGVSLAVVVPLMELSAFSHWVGHALQILPMVLLAAGMIGVRAFQGESLGKTGKVGFLLAFAGAGLFAAISAVFVLYEGLWNMDSSLFHGPEIAFLMLLLAGSLLLGVATLRAGMLPRWGALLLIVGSVAAPLYFLGAVVFFAGWTRLGFALLSKQAAPDGRAALAR
jgi:hypothetical protein